MDGGSEALREVGARRQVAAGVRHVALDHPTDLLLKERLVIANAVTAFFVTHATAPNKEELLAQIANAASK